MNLRDPSEPLSTKQIEIDLLKIKNLSLSNKLSTVKREISEIMQKPEVENKKAETILVNFNRFKTHWAKYVEQIRSSRFLFKLAIDEQLTNILATRFFEMKNAIDNLNIEEKEEEFNRTMEDVFNNMAQFYADFIEDFLKNSSNSIDYLKKEFGISDETKKPSEAIIQENIKLRIKIDELAQSIDKIQNYDAEMRNKQIFEEITKARNKCQGLEEALKDLREKNESVNRRFKFLFKNQFVWTDELEEEIQRSKIGCICGGKVFDHLNIQSIKVSKQVTELVEENKISEDAENLTAEDQEKNFYSSSEQIQKLETQIKELQEENTKLKAEKVKMKFRMDNADERFFESKLFTTLVTQGQELLKFSASLKKKISETSNVFDDIEKSRITEIEEILKKTLDDKKKFTDMIQDLAISYDEEKKKFELLEQDLIKQHDLLMNFTHVNTLLRESDERYNNLYKETFILRGQVKDLNDRLTSASSQVNELSERVAKLNNENIQMRSMIKDDVKFEEKPFRHSKHKEFFNQLFELDQKNNLGVKDKIEDLKKYIKTREDKAEIAESKNKKLSDDAEKNKKQFDGLINEVQINGQVTEDYRKKYNEMNEQLKLQTDSISALIKDKASAKAQFDNEHRDLIAKIKNDKELIERFENHIKQVEAKYQALLSEKHAIEEIITLQKQIIEESKHSRENLLKKIEELKIEISLGKETQNKLENMSNNFFKENESLKTTLKQKQEFITQKLQRSKAGTKRSDLDDDDIELLQLENEKYRRMILCSVCGNKDKSVVLAKCFHTFCKECISNTMTVRNRKCPKCNNKIGNEDIKNIWWD